MKIESLTLTNFRGIREMTLEFNERLTVLVGVNGAGKSSVVDALTVLLSWGIAAVTDPDEKGTFFRIFDITSGARHSFAGLTVECGGRQYGWSVLRREPGFDVASREPVRGERDFAASIRRRITETDAKCSIPLMAMYHDLGSVELSFPRRSRTGESVLDAYDESLSGSAKFSSFLNWLREQDDIANENRGGREWFIHNKAKIEEGFERLTNVLAECVKQAGGDPANLADPVEHIWWQEHRSSDDPSQFFHGLYGHLADMAVRPSRHRLKMLVQEVEHISSGTQKAEFSRRGMDRWLKFVERTLGAGPSGGFPSHDLSADELRFFWPFLRELLAFAMEWSFWWMSLEAGRRLGNVIRNGVPDRTGGQDTWEQEARSLTDQLRKIVEDEVSSQHGNVNDARRRVRLVARAIESFVPEFTNLRVSRTPTVRMLVEKEGKTFDITQLSDGERRLIAMIGDLARRLVIANPTMENPLEGEGVVLIDEIDLHLHPTWQRMVAPRLIATFPNVQFIITTHSPQVLSHVEDKSVFLLRQTDRGIVHVPLSEAYGQSYERLLEDVFGVATRPDEIQAELDELFDLIQRERIQEARDKLQELRRRIGTDPDLVRAGFLLHRKEEVGQ